MLAGRTIMRFSFGGGIPSKSTKYNAATLAVSCIYPALMHQYGIVSLADTRNRRAFHNFAAELGHNRVGVSTTALDR